MAIYILVSGAWHAAWCWERLVPQLESEGHIAIAPDLIGMTDDGVAPQDVTLATWADQIAHIVEKQSEPVILVGHSRGGIVISEAAERVPRQIRTLVYLSAFMLRSGETLVDASSSVKRDFAADIIIPSANMSSYIRSDAVGPVFYNTTDDLWKARAVSQVSPEPTAPMNTPVGLTPARFGSVKRAYIECLQDLAIPLALQRKMQEALPCDPVFQLDTDHSPFFSDPENLAKCLVELAS